jgi:small GTP-binding protein
MMIATIIIVIVGVIYLTSSNGGRRWMKSMKEYLKYRYNRSSRVIMSGIDNSGKTTLLHMLRSDRFSTHHITRYEQPYQGEPVDIGNGMHMLLYDLGGMQPVRRTIANYASHANGIIFMIDAADSQRFNEAKNELSYVFTLAKGKPILILANKIDQQKNAKSLNEITTSLNLPPKPVGKDLEQLQQTFKHNINTSLMESYHHLHHPHGNGNGSPSSSNCSNNHSHWISDLSLIVWSYIDNTLPGYDDIIELTIKGLPTKYHVNGYVGVFRIMPCSVVKRMGYNDGIKWLYHQSLPPFPALSLLFSNSSDKKLHEQ